MTREESTPKKKTVTVTVDIFWGTITVVASVDNINGIHEQFESAVRHHAANCGPYKKDRWHLSDTIARLPGHVSGLSVTFDHKTLEFAHPLPDGGCFHVTCWSLGLYTKLPNDTREALLATSRTFNRDATENEKREWAQKAYKEFFGGKYFPNEMLVSIAYLAPPGQVPPPEPLRIKASSNQA